MSKRRSSNASAGANGKIYKDSNVQQGTPKKSSLAVMQKIRAKASPYQLPIPTAAVGVPTITAGIPFIPSVPPPASTGNYHIPRPPHFYTYQHDPQTMHAMYVQQLMAAQGLQVQHVHSLHTGN